MIDFGAMPISNAFLDPQNVSAGEMVYPLRIMACGDCELVQVAEGLPANAHFHDRYAYFSSFSSSWLAHCKAYSETVIERFGLVPDDLVVEVASNDGYLLTYFKDRGLRTLGIEPSESVATAARAKGIDTQTRFFGVETANDLLAAGLRPKLIVANNVFAHVPDLADFTAGFARLLDGDAVLTVEAHYFGSLFKNVQFDSFYHEHYCYYTVTSAERLLKRHGLRLFDIEFLPTHGGSIRLYVCREDASHETTARVLEAMAGERQMFASLVSDLDAFRDRIDAVGETFRQFLTDAKRSGKKVAGFGAPAKATTLLNYARITRNLLPYTVDSNPQKQGLLIPGVHIPILAPQQIEIDAPDYVVLLPWNLKAELTTLFAPWRSFGTRFVCVLPELEIL